MASMSYVKSLSRWRVRWRATNRKMPKGDPRRVFSGSGVFIEKTQALQCLMEMEQQERLWRTGDVDVVERIDRAVSEFKRHCKRHTKRTQGLYEDITTCFIESLPNNVVRIQQIEAAHIKEFCHLLRDKGNSNRTINSKLTVVKSFCRFCEDFYGIKNPAKAVPMLTEDPPKARWLSRKEYDKALEVATDLAKDRIVFLANTGLRSSELAKLRLNPEMKAITVTGKGRKERTIPLNSKAQDVLKRKNIYAPVTKNSLELQFARVAEKAKIPKFGPHALRHFFATELLKAGVPIIKVSMLLGHASVTTTQRRYAHILSADLEGVTDIL